MTETAFLLRFHAVFCLVSAVALRTCLMSHYYLLDDVQQNNDDNNDNNNDNIEGDNKIGGEQQGGCQDIGNTLSLLVALWHVVILVQSLRLQYRQLLSYYRFLLPFSICQVLPDLFLVTITKTLYFPTNGSSWMIGNDAVSPCMAGMWSIPGLMILYFSFPTDNSTDNDTDDDNNNRTVVSSGSSIKSDATYCRSNNKKKKEVVSLFQYIKAACSSLLILGLAEQLFSFIWHRTEEVKIIVGGSWGNKHNGIALYVLPAETMLGPTIMYAYHTTKDGPWWYSTIGAAITMLVYTGALSIGLLAIEGGSSTTS